ncbi:MAG TPA: ArsR family transcriptional regulator [Methanoregulaceae archaeon]|nr:ArsR family transcriptional regulator [Methanoregulaceae archaeon]HPD76522.1 ArsR family transcriptional regulator [Methanoregulaceae archaeon]HRY76159.1 ArsR family transcriptional regulator [Methanoregulaceae archaeon]
MRTENIVYFTEKEEECANLLIAIGLKRYVAKTLVFLSGNPAATSRAIERGTDLRQPEVSIAVGDMTKLGWIRNRESMVKGQGRPIKVYELVKSFPEILDFIEKTKQKKAEQERQMLEKLRGFAG